MSKSGNGWSISSLEEIGTGPGFRKVRSELGVTEFGANAIVLPPRYQTGFHLHERQQELYLVLDGTVEFELGDGTVETLEAGGLARIDAEVPRRIRNATTEEASYFIVGGAGGYVGRDGKIPEGETSNLGGPLDA